MQLDRYETGSETFRFALPSWFRFKDGNGSGNVHEVDFKAQQYLSSSSDDKHVGHF